MKRVHRMCEYLRRSDAYRLDKDPRAVKCLECPRWEETLYGRGTRGCRVRAMEPIRLTIWGNIGGWRRHWYLARCWLRNVTPFPLRRREH